MTQNETRKDEDDDMEDVEEKNKEGKEKHNYKHKDTKLLNQQDNKQQNLV